MSKERDSITSDLLPPVPEGLSVEPPQFRTIGDLNLYPFLEVIGANDVRLSPDVIRLFPQLLPIMEFVAEAVKRTLGKQHEIASDDQDANSDLERFVDNLVRTLNVRIPVAISDVLLKDRYADRPLIIELIGGVDALTEEKIKEIARKAISFAIDEGIVANYKEISQACNINAGQLTNFKRAAGPLAIEKVTACLEYLVKKAKSVDRFMALKGIIAGE